MTLVIAALVALLGATVQSATGFGFALILGPVLFAVLDRASALTTLLALGATLSVLVLFGERRERHIRWRELSALLAAATPGLILGVLILGVVTKPVLQLAVGIAVLGAVVLQARQQRRATTGAPAVSPGRAVIAVGIVAGLLTTTTGTNGPPLVLWFQRRTTNSHEVRDSITAGSLALSILGASTLAASGQGHQDFKLRWMIFLLIATAVGHQLGRRLFQRLGADQFRTTGLALSAIAGIASITAATAAR